MRRPRQDIRPLRIGLLNLMPNKIRTETQFARLVGATPLQVELTLSGSPATRPRTRRPITCSPSTASWEDVRSEKFDGFIVTGAPVELLPIRGGDLLGRAAAHLRLDAEQRAFDHEHLLGRPGGASSFPRRAQTCAAGQGVRRLPPPQSQSVIALSARLLRRFLHSRFALDRGAPRRSSRRRARSRC